MDPGGEVTRLSDPDLVEQRAVVIGGLLVVPDPGGDEHRRDPVKIGTQAAWSVTMWSMLAHSFLAAAGSVCCAACAWLASWSA